MKTPGSKDKNGAARCYLHDQDPGWYATPFRFHRDRTNPLARRDRLVSLSKWLKSRLK
jgi:hypothetical protein